MNNHNIYTPGYAVYDNEILSRLALINYLTDPSGMSDYTTTFSFDTQTPTEVEVKCGVLVFLDSILTSRLGIWLPPLLARRQISLGQGR